MEKEIHIHGGVVDSINAQGGIVYLYNGVVKSLNLQSGRFIQHGGILNNNVQTEPKVIYKDRIIYRDSTMVGSLLEKIRKLEEELGKKKAEETKSDDVLVRRIEHLESVIELERRQHERKINELKENLKGVKEAYHNLLHQQKNVDTNKLSQQIADEHIDILATLMAAYPFTPTEDLSLEFGITPARINYVAQVLGSIKSKEARLEAREYLRRQNIQFIDRRGGNQGNFPNKKQVEKVARNGRMIETYDSITEAMEKTGMCEKTIRLYCNAKKKKYTKDGYTFRFKQQ
jgi:DNA-binding transcriptional MerR regulator